jgi:hypothetical protein
MMRESVAATQQHSVVNKQTHVSIDGHNVVYSNRGTFGVNNNVRPHMVHNHVKKMSKSTKQDARDTCPGRVVEIKPITSECGFVVNYFPLNSDLCK